VQVQAAKEFAAQTEELVELHERESVERVASDQEAARRAGLGALQVSLLAVAGLTCLQSSLFSELHGQEANIAVADTLYDDIMKDDLDLSRIRSFPGIQSVLDECAHVILSLVLRNAVGRLLWQITCRFRESFRELSENFKTNALEANANILKEVNAFQDAVKASQNAAVEKSIEHITAFQKLKKTVRVLLHLLTVVSFVVFVCLWLTRMVQSCSAGNEAFCSW
jgi:hypothetical protein